MGRIKGTSVVALVRVLRKNRELAVTLLPPHLHGYLTERILPSSWYPDAEYLVLIRAVGKMLAPLVSGDVWEFIGEQGAASDFSGVYSTVVRKDDPWTALGHSDKIWTLYHDEGTLEMTRMGPTTARMRLSGYGSACPEVCGTLNGYFRTLVELSGGKNVRATMHRAAASKAGAWEWTVEFES